MAGNQPLFGATVHEVGIAQEGTLKEQMRAREIGASKGDVVDAGQLLGQAAQLATNMKNAEITSEANNAKQDYLELTMSEAYRDGDATVRAGMLEEIYGTLHEKPKAYQDAFTSYSSSSYKKEYDARGEIEDNSFYSAAPAAFKVHEMETGEGAEEFAAAYKEANPRLDINVIKTSLLEGAYQEIFTEVSSATNEKELSEALANIQDIKAPYQTSKFLQTKSKKGKELITAAETQLNTLIKAKEAEFVTMHKSNIDSAIDSKYSEHPARLEEDFDAAYKDPITRGNKKREYSEKYQESTEAHSFNATFPLGSNPGKYPNDMAKEYRQLAVTEELPRLFAEGNVTEFVRIADNEAKLTKETGDMLLAQINKSTDPAELANIFTTLNKINAQPKGPGVIRQMLTDDEYARIMKVQYVSTYRPDYSPQQARDYVDGAKRNIARASMTKKKMIEMDEYAVALGKQGQKFLGVMKSFIDTDPQMAEDLMKDVAKFFDGQVGESTTGKPTDISMGSVPESLDPERTDKMIDEALPNTSSIAYIDNMIIGYDDIGGVVKIVNSDGIIKRSDSNTEDLAIREQMATKEGVKTSPITGAGVAVESFGRTVVDNLGRFVTGIFPTFKELGSNIAGAIGDNAMRNLRQTIKNSPEFVQDSVGFVNKFLEIEIDNPKQAEQVLDNTFDEFYLESLKEQSDNLNTRMPEVQNNTLTPDVQASLAYALANNKVEKERVDNTIMELETKPITEEEEPMVKEVVTAATIALAPGNFNDLTDEQNRTRLLESVKLAEAGYTDNPKDRGNWVQGKLIGTNHGVSAPILAKWLGRVPTVSDMKNLSKKEANEIMWKDFGERYKVEALPRDLQEIVLHGIVNSGGHAVKVMQKLLGVEADGAVGPATIKAMQKAKFTKKDFKDALLRKYRTFGSWKDFGKGWTNRFERLAQ